MKEPDPLEFEHDHRAFRQCVGGWEVYWPGRSWIALKQKSKAEIIATWEETKKSIVKDIMGG